MNRFAFAGVVRFGVTMLFVAAAVGAPVVSTFAADAKAEKKADAKAEPKAKGKSKAAAEVRRKEKENEKKPFFDGKTIDGWVVRGGTATYKVEDGAIVGTTAEGSPNTFLTKGPYGDFELTFEVKCDNDLNSGVQIRSQLKKEDAKEGKPARNYVFGYQCEIAPGDLVNCGNFWDEARAGKWWDDFTKKDKKVHEAFKRDEWNKYRIVAQGDHIRSWVNGVPAADFHDKTDASGLIGLQVHGIGKGKGPYSVRWRNLNLRELQPGEKVE